MSKAGAASSGDRGPLRICLLSYRNNPHSGGQGVYVRNLGRALAPGGTLLVVAHDSSNLAEGTGGPQDPAVLYTAADVLDDLAGASFETVMFSAASFALTIPQVTPPASTISRPIRMLTSPSVRAVLARSPLVEEFRDALVRCAHCPPVLPKYTGV